MSTAAELREATRQAKAGLGSYSGIASTSEVEEQREAARQTAAEYRGYSEWQVGGEAVKMPPKWKPTGTEVCVTGPSGSGGVTLTPEAYAKIAKITVTGIGLKPKTPESILMKSQDWAKYPPTQQEQAKVFLESQYAWSPFAKQFIKPAPSWQKVTSPEEAIKVATAFAKADIETPAPGALYKKGEEYAIVPAPFQTMREWEKAYKKQQKYEKSLMQKKEELARLAKEQPLVYGLEYWTSAWAKGPITALGIAGETLLQPVESLIKKESLEKARERELEEFAKRTLGIEKEPVTTVALGMTEAPFVVGTSYLLGRIGTKLAVMSATAGKAFSLGLKGAGVVLSAAHVAPPILEQKYAKAGGRAAEIAGAIPFAYVGYKKGVEAQLMKEYPKMLGIPEEKFRLARKAGEIKPEVRDVKAVLKEMPRMKGETGEVVGDYLSRHTDVTVGGSVAQRTQVSGRTPRDIDLFTNQPQARATELYNALIRAGVPAKLQIVGSGEKLSGKIFVSGYKLAEFHTTTWLASFPFYAGTTETPEGVKVIKISEQLYRKTIGGITREKDIADFQSAVKSLIRTGEIKAEKGISLLRPYRESKVAELKQLAFGVKGYASFKTPDISKAPLITPTLSMATPEYKPTKPLKISKVSYTPPKAAEVSYPVLTSKTAKYPAIVRKPTAKYPTTKPKKITEYPALLKKITAEYPPLLKPAKYPAYPLKAPMALTLARHEPKKYERKKYYGAPITQPSIELYGRLGTRDRYPKIRVGKPRQGEVLLMPKADWISIQKEEMRTGRKAKHPAITRLTRKEYARRLHGPGAAALRFPTARGWSKLTKKGRKESLLLLKPKKRRKKSRKKNLLLLKPKKRRKKR